MRLLAHPGATRPLRAAHHQELGPSSKPDLRAPEHGLPVGVQAEAAQGFSGKQVGLGAFYN